MVDMIVSEKIGNISNKFFKFGYDYCDNFPSFFENSKKSLKQSSVGKMKGIEIDENVRKCKFMYTTLHIKSPEIIEIIHDMMKKMVPKMYHTSLSKHEEYTCQMLVYEEGDFFKKHRDTVKKEEHFASILIIPPMCHEINTHTGGKLNIFDQNNIMHSFESENSEDWQIIMFNPSLEHECLPVSSGNRIIFKLDGMLDSDKYCIVKKIENQEIKCCHNISPYDILQLEISKINSEISEHLNSFSYCGENNTHHALRDKIDKKIENIVDMIDTVRGKFRENYIGNILKIISSSKKNTIVHCLDMYYEDVNWLSTGDFELFTRIKMVYPNVVVKNINNEFNIIDYAEEYEESEGDKEEYGENFRKICFENYLLSDVDVINLHTHFKKHISSKFEYNDSTYDKKVLQTITVFVINKY